MAWRPSRAAAIRRGAPRTGSSRSATRTSSSSPSSTPRRRPGAPSASGSPARSPAARSAGPFEPTRSRPSRNDWTSPSSRDLERSRTVRSSPGAAQASTRRFVSPGSRSSSSGEMACRFRERRGRRAGRSGDAQAAVGGRRSGTPLRLARRPRSADRRDGSVRFLGDHPDARSRRLHPRLTSRAPSDRRCTPDRQDEAGPALPAPLRDPRRRSGRRGNRAEGTC